MSDLANLIGCPYAQQSTPPRTFNCWTLVLHVRALLGLRLPRVLPDVSAAVETRFLEDRNLDAVIAHLREGQIFQAVDRPQEGTMVFLKPDYSHIGIWVAGGVMHACESLNGVRHYSLPVCERFFGNASFWEAAHG